MERAQVVSLGLAGESLDEANESTPVAELLPSRCPRQGRRWIRTEDPGRAGDSANQLIVCQGLAGGDRQAAGHYQERVRQLDVRIMNKLRTIAKEQKVDLPYAVSG